MAGELSGCCDIGTTMESLAPLLPSGYGPVTVEVEERYRRRMHRYVTGRGDPRPVPAAGDGEEPAGPFGPNGSASSP